MSAPRPQEPIHLGGRDRRQRQPFRPVQGGANQRHLLPPSPPRAAQGEGGGAPHRSSEGRPGKAGRAPRETTVVEAAANSCGRPQKEVGEAGKGSAAIQNPSPAGGARCLSHIGRGQGVRRRWDSAPRRRRHRLLADHDPRGRAGRWALQPAPKWKPRGPLRPTEGSPGARLAAHVTARRGWRLNNTAAAVRKGRAGQGRTGQNTRGQARANSW